MRLGLHGFLELAIGADLDGGALGQKRVGDLREVVHVRTEDWPAVHGRSGGCCVRRPAPDLPPTKTAVAIRYELRELADRVQNHRVDSRLRVDREIAAALGRQTFALAQALDVAKPLGMTRGENEQRVVAQLRRPDSIEGTDDRLFLSLRGAAGHEHEPPRRDPEEAQNPFASAAGGCRGIECVELEAAGHGDTTRIGAELAQPARRLLALHAEAIDVAEDSP